MGLIYNWFLNSILAYASVKLVNWPDFHLTGSVKANAVRLCIAKAIAFTHTLLSSLFLLCCIDWVIELEVIRRLCDLLRNQHNCRIVCWLVWHYFSDTRLWKDLTEDQCIQTSNLLPHWFAVAVILRLLVLCTNFTASYIKSSVISRHITYWVFTLC